MDNSFQILPVDETNAVQAGVLFRSVYGEDFPVRYVYQPELLWQEIQSDRLSPALAFDPEGRPAGYIALFKSAPNPRLWETGNMIVHPDYRATDLADRLLKHYFDPTLCRRDSHDGIFAETVCNHFFTQIAAVKSGLTVCALALDQLAASALAEDAADGRVACVLSFLEFGPPSSPLYLPHPYQELLPRLARTLPARTFLPSAAPLPTSGQTRRIDAYYESARTWKVAVPEIGGDWPEFLASLVAEAQRRQTISLQVTVNAALPCVGDAVGEMRRNGFFLGGLMPRWFGGDGLLMQRVLGKEPDYGAIRLYSPHAKELLAFIRADRETVLAANTTD